MVNKVDGIGHKPAIDRMEVLMDGSFSGRNIIIPPVCYNKKRIGHVFKDASIEAGKNRMYAHFGAPVPVQVLSWALEE